MILLNKIWKKYNEIELTKNKMDLNNRKMTNHRGSTIQYGYRKRGTHARVFSQTLAHGNRKNEIRQ